MSRKIRSYATYADFKNELMHRGSAPFCTEVEELADEMYQVEFDNEPDAMWDKSDSDEE